jgi:PAS domain S-box-containing protein
MAVILEVLSWSDVESVLAGGGDAALRDAVAEFLRGALDDQSPPAAVNRSLGLATTDGVDTAGFQWAHELLEALPAAVYTTDAAGRITYYNQAAVELWGRRPEPGNDQWCGSWRLYWPDGTPMRHDECPMAVALRENRAVRGVEAVAERPDGTRIPFIPYPTPLRGASGTVIGAVNMLVDITDRKAAEAALREREEQSKVLAREVDHRARNILAIVQAIARRTEAESVPAFIEALNNRLRALARANTLLAESRWHGADLRALLEQELAAYGGSGGRVTLSGAPLALALDAAQPLAMAVHELAANAAKYGALSVPGGRVAVEWSCPTGGPFVLRWRETGGPRVSEPSRRGYGSELIEILARQLDGELRFDWCPDGLVCEVRLPPGTLASIPAAAE